MAVGLELQPLLVQVAVHLELAVAMGHPRGRLLVVDHGSADEPQVAVVHPTLAQAATSQSVLPRAAAAAAAASLRRGTRAAGRSSLGCSAAPPPRSCARSGGCPCRSAAWSVASAAPCPAAAFGSQRSSEKQPQRQLVPRTRTHFDVVLAEMTKSPAAARTRSSRTAP